MGFVDTRSYGGGSSFSPTYYRQGTPGNAQGWGNFNAQQRYDAQGPQTPQEQYPDQYPIGPNIRIDPGINQQWQRDLQINPQLRSGYEAPQYVDPSLMLQLLQGQGNVLQTDAMLALSQQQYANQRANMLAQQAAQGKMAELERAYWEGRPGAAEAMAALKQQMLGTERMMIGTERDLLGGRRDLLSNELGDLNRRIDMGRFETRSDAGARGAWGSRGMGLRLNDLDRQLMLGTAANQIQGRQLDTQGRQLDIKGSQLDIQGRQIDQDLADQLALYRYRAGRAGAESDAQRLGFNYQLGAFDDRNAMNYLQALWNLWNQQQQNDYLQGQTGGAQGAGAGNPGVQHYGGGWGNWRDWLN